VDEEWRRSSDRPLPIVGGEFGIAYAITFYLPQHPAVYPVLEPAISPWVTAADIAREGAVMVCPLAPNEHRCVYLIDLAIHWATIANPPPRYVEVELRRTYFGIAGEPKRYLITIVPPLK
jgi:hypothetical protein